MTIGHNQPPQMLLKKYHEKFDDSGIVLIDDDLEIDTEKISEERKAYLEESRSQDASE